ncbi:MAG: alpha-ketoacid dehydrogenase subunit beta [Gemmatimonadota bacterium]|jgi:2-oxoisovalerate dehydrogenase E1 component beta subunit|nr:alpha-ketoacid dehydrogenase subunit beta [Gemmatimonadota bacterium]MDP6461769.1 alpha-ketoacid dehydrogenase subunit beta [Gemmatimonadota bacterium]MDP6529701.1 alpha-ketoacid dehydrogenase subunit beta [Gemmatimonadota bacterium]MDP6802488.1 alpha-ketoacid dehydrogenase subunit beta [Gemmatimonadota bacterium]MDP7030955.1 alpha-ketoacid dehydrogenase subunit beta [Gemmatimonadota bacterium]
MPTLTFVDAVREGIRAELLADPSVFVIGEDVGTYGGAFRATRGFLDEFGPERIVDTPISESAIVGAAVGAAMNGLRPVAEMQFIDFLSCAFNQVVNMAAKARYRWNAGVPIVVRGPCGGGVHGGPFHSQNVESHYLSTPGLKIVEPATALDAYGLMRAAIRDPDPVLFFEHKYLYRRVRDEIPAGEFTVPIGKARIHRDGTDLSVVTFGACVHHALEAADLLAAEGISIEVVDLRTLLPIDEDALLATARRTNKVIIYHEAQRTGGIGGELSAILAERCFDSLDGPVVRVTAPDTPVPFSPPLEEAYLPGVADLVEAARQLAAY